MIGAMTVNTEEGLADLQKKKKKKKKTLLPQQRFYISISHSGKVEYYTNLAESFLSHLPSGLYTLSYT